MKNHHQWAQNNDTNMKVWADFNKNATVLIQMRVKKYFLMKSNRNHKRICWCLAKLKSRLPILIYWARIKQLHQIGRSFLAKIKTQLLTNGLQLQIFRTFKISLVQKVKKKNLFRKAFRGHRRVVLCNGDQQVYTKVAEMVKT